MVIDLKDEIDNLLRFFDAVAQLVQVCTDFQVQEFLDFLANQVDRLDGGAIAGFTFGDFRRQEVFTMVIMIRAYYVVFNRIANMYTNTSKDNIMPGIKMVNRLSAPGLTSVQMAEKHTELRDYTKKSMQDITAMVASVSHCLISLIVLWLPRIGGHHVHHSPFTSFSSFSRTGSRRSQGPAAQDGRPGQSGRGLATACA